MADEKKFSITLKNRYGLHIRPATMLAALARQYKSTIMISRRGVQPANADNPMELLTLGAESGVQLEIEVRGEDAEAAGESVRELIDGSFGNIE